MLLASGGMVLAGLLPLVLLRNWILPLWLGAETAGPVAAILPIFAFAVLFHAMGCAPYFLAYGLGKPLLNSYYSATILVVNALALGALKLTGHMTLTWFCWAFALSQIFAVLAYHGGMECIIWRSLMAERGARPEKLPESGSTAL